MSELAELDPDHDFVRRHVGPSPAEIAQMLATIGCTSLDQLVDEVVPAHIRTARPLDLPAPVSPAAATRELRATADRNQVVTSLIGQGYAASITPPVIARNLLANPAWYTAYTPYQPEISQGRLEALLNFQTVIADLTGLDLATASLLDEATAAGEAMTMARRLTRRGDVFFVHADTHPQTIEVLRTRAEPVGVRLVVGETDQLHDGDELCGALFSSPTSTGAVVDWSADIDRVHALGAIAVVATDPLACTLICSPAAMGADIAVGSAQRFGVPLGFGGPHAGFIAARADAARSLPGRIVGVSHDTEDRPALRLALQTREQHIRREKATSNICTAQVLLANIASMYAVYHGPDGLRSIAERVHGHTTVLARALLAAGRELRHATWFDTITVDGVDADAVLAAGRDAGVNLRRVDDRSVGVTFDEVTSAATVAAAASAFGVSLGRPVDPSAADAIPQRLRRTDEILTAAVFHEHRSEHRMLRYLRRLADRDLALDRGMIPLGSCTMKLNAAAEMEPIEWAEFASLHPFIPDEQSVGYRDMISELEGWLAEITGYDAVSVQPNAGSQGEFAGLLAIRRYHRSRGDDRRTVCLIPSSAHGTNAASAVMAGLEVVVVACDDDGNVSLDDLDAKIAAADDRLAAAMVTYPSTHGVFEPAITDLCDRVHAAGGQVYVDGANLNALVGLVRLGEIGADVSHLNLHKTFCIPHGGGGPGVGPVGVRGHLAPFLPGDPRTTGGGAVSAAPYGSAGILPISWMYLRMMGHDGLRHATSVAILAANYVAARLADAFPVLYSGEHGRVAHECIIDLRPITAATGVTVDDVAKRLIDYGFHAPTMSFPVAGTFMIEPTESEDLAEIDRFCDAMLAIRSEIAQIEAGAIGLDDSPLRRAPHTAADLIGTWGRSYERSEGAFPVASLLTDKYFPPVSRIDGASGDRHLVCTCEPLHDLAATGG